MRYPLRHEGLRDSKRSTTNWGNGSIVLVLQWKSQIRALAIPSNRDFRDSRENPVAIAHLHTTLNKSRDEKLIMPVSVGVYVIVRR